KFFKRRHFNLVSKITPQDKILPVDWLSGACLLIKKTTIEKIGLFDEHYFMFYEDVDYCRRAEKNGLKIGYFPQYSIVHKQGASIAASDERTIRNAHRQSQLYYWDTHLPLLEKLLLKTCFYIKILFSPSSYK
ncbi:MAG: glycosyltransferase, partial [Candidatus Omnitrophica bacterium]|nr:glycosyltransferase [Candidatus Omnitrophota bacterium]